MILLDTHVFYWVLASPERLGPACRGSIEQAKVVHVSAISHVEFRIKVATGRRAMPPATFADLAARGFRELPFTHSHAARLADLPDDLARHDPFDRMLLAQALDEGLTFWTSDRRLLAQDLEFVRDANA